ncbi:MAG: NAD-dependent epimerase/dehydratase family protein [Planctomycetota bacterium]|nr:NAD-dependent epimerase/dehydratase family protein [Planctomycetota bacterium]
MDILILGGTQFIGHHIALALLGRGHRVSVFNRGVTPDVLPREVERLHGDRDLGAEGLGSLRRRAWDVCIDVSGYTAVHVRSSATLLRGCIGRYVYISAVSVYGDPQERPVRESHPRSEPAPESVTEVVGEMYGRLKVTCENIVEELHGDAAAMLRPQIVIGPGDPSSRLTRWIAHALAQGPILAPGDGTDHVQCIDVRDLAAFACIVAERGLSGPFNLAGPRLTWAAFMTLLGARDPIWVPQARLRAAGLTEFELPLYRAEHGPRSGLMDVCNLRALGVGLVLTDPVQTVGATRTWMAGSDLPRLFSRELELQLLAQT